MFMSKFDIITCEKQESSNSYAVGFSPIEDPDIALYFPIPEEDAFLLKFMLDPDKEEKDAPPNMKLLGMYKTMLDGFESSGTFLSGVVFNFENVEGEEILSCKLCLSKIDGGLLENMMNTTFSIAVVLAIMSGIEVFMTDDLVRKLLPTLENGTSGSTNDIGQLTQEIQKTKKPDEKNKKLPIDKNIEKIAKQIMSGQAEIKKQTKSNKTPKGKTGKTGKADKANTNE